MVKITHQGLPIIELLNVLEPILNKNTNTAYAHLGTYKAIRGNLVALLYHDLNKARYTTELEQLRKLEEFESALIIRESIGKAKIEEQLKNLKALIH
jgi:protein-arginine kinase activator protein McsA